MKINFELTQKILHHNGYVEERTRNGLEWEKKIGKQDFPRFHIIVKDDGERSIHIDQRKHGSFMQWLGLSRGNGMTQESDEIRREVMRIRLDTYDVVVEVLKKKILELRSNL